MVCVCGEVIKPGLISGLWTGLDSGLDWILDWTGFWTGVKEFLCLIFSLLCLRVYPDCSYLPVYWPTAMAAVEEPEVIFISSGNSSMG